MIIFLQRGFTLVLGSHDDQRPSTLITKSRIELTEGWIPVFVRPRLRLIHCYFSHVALHRSQVET